MLGDTQVVKDKEERRLSKVKISIMRNPRFALWSGLMTVGRTSVDDNIPTACTNGRDERYGREFVKTLDDKELAFVVLHETLHKAYRHLFTWRRLNDENPHLANLACDYVINLQLKDMDKDELLINTTSDAGDYKLQVNGNGRFAGDIITSNGNIGVYNSNVQVQFIDVANSNYTYSLQNYSSQFRLYNNNTSTTVLNFTSGSNAEFAGSIKTAAPYGGTAKPWIITKDATLIGSYYVDFNTSVCKGSFDPMLVNHLHVTH